jgi:carboxyl-terminal processing protease
MNPKTFKQAYVLTLLVILGAVTGFAAGYLLRPDLPITATDWPVLQQAYQILADHGLKSPLEPPKLEYGMIRGMVQAYEDPYTQFVEPVQHELEGNLLQGSFGGIGVRIGRDADGNVVLYPLPGGPAQEAGVQEGDRLIKAADLEVSAETTDEQIQAALRGPVGERVNIIIARAPDYQPVELRIKRAEIPLPSVTWHLDPDEPSVGVIEINVVAATTPEEIEKAVEDLNGRGATAYILDLRDNFGGLLDAGVDTARLFLKEGMVIEQQYKGKDVESFKVERPGSLADIPLVILVNENTASAAEIIAGALKAQGRAKIIGKPTYGKDTIQLVFDLQDGSSLHVTSAHWWVPGLDPMLQGNGVKPDVLVESAAGASVPDPVARAAADLLLDK